MSLPEIATREHLARRRKREPKPDASRVVEIGFGDDERQGPPLDVERQLDATVMTIPQWCKQCGFSVWTGQRLLKAGKGPKVTQISDRRIGITLGHHREWLASRVR